MYWKKGKEIEIEALKEKIQSSLNDSNVTAIASQSQTGQRFSAIENQVVLVREISEKVWMHQQHTKENEKEDLIQDARDDVAQYLRRTEDRLQDIHRDSKGEIQSSNRQYSASAIRKVMKILKDDLEKQFDPKNYSADVKGFLQFNPLHHAWENRENVLISEIQELLDKYAPGINPHWKVDILSSIFDKCDLWPDKKNAYATMRKRLRAISQKKLSQQ